MRTYPVGYSYDPQGRMKTMTNWTGLAGGTGARVTSWNYSTNRGFLTNKAYADGTGPNYTYTAAGRLKTRVWVRGITTTYATNAFGDVASIAYSDSTPSVTFNLDRQGRATNVRACQRCSPRQCRAESHHS